jgi:hypothetical protein
MHCSTSSAAALRTSPSKEGSKCSATPPSAGTTSRMNGTARATIAAPRRCATEFTSRSSVRENST